MVIALCVLGALLFIALFRILFLEAAKKETEAARIAASNSLVQEKNANTKLTRIVDALVRDQNADRRQIEKFLHNREVAADELQRLGKDIGCILAESGVLYNGDGYGRSVEGLVFWGGFDMGYETHPDYDKRLATGDEPKFGRLATGTKVSRADGVEWVRLKTRANGIAWRRTDTIIPRYTTHDDMYKRGYRVVAE